MSILGHLKEYYNKVMDLPDAPNKVARGASWGLALDFLPIPIFSIPLAYVMARITGGNGLAGALTAALFKLAVPFFYVLNITTGNFLLGLHLPNDIVALAMMGTLEHKIEQLLALGPPFLVGSLVNAFLAWLLIFFVVKRLLLLRQQYKEHRI